MTVTSSRAQAVAVPRVALDPTLTRLCEPGQAPAPPRWSLSLRERPRALVAAVPRHQRDHDGLDVGREIHAVATSPRRTCCSSGDRPHAFAVCHTGRAANPGAELLLERWEPFAPSDAASTFVNCSPRAGAGDRRMLRSHGRVKTARHERTPRYCGAVIRTAPSEWPDRPNGPATTAGRLPYRRWR